MNIIAYDCRNFAKKSEKSNLKKLCYMKEFSGFNGALYDIHKTMADPFWKVLAVVCFENRGFLSRARVFYVFHKKNLGGGHFEPPPPSKLRSIYPPS